MTVIPFSEVVQGTKSDPHEQERIQLKEAIYRGLIEKEAMREGRPFETMLKIVQGTWEEVKSENNSASKHEDIAQRKGISLYEHELGEQIAYLEFAEKTRRLKPDLLLPWEIPSGCNL